MRVAMLGRFFGRLTGGNWRPPADELRFARSAGFDGVQVRSDQPGRLEDELQFRLTEHVCMCGHFHVDPLEQRRVVLYR